MGMGSLYGSWLPGVFRESRSEQWEFVDSRKRRSDGDGKEHHHNKARIVFGLAMDHFNP